MPQRATPEILAMLPTREEWMEKLPILRLAGLIVSKSDQDAAIMAKVPNVASQMSILAETAQQLEVLADVLRTAEARLREYSAP